jgi:hypothetical protein
MSIPAHAAHTGHYYRDAATWTDADGSQHWVTRAANFVVVTTRAQPGAVVSRSAEQQSDEYMLLLPVGMKAQIHAGADAALSDGDSLTIVPPGDSRITLPEGGWAYRVFSKLSADLLALAPNHATYAGETNVAELVTWPEPVGGYKLRHYDLARYARTDTTMRLFRTRNLMINIFLPSKAPRDITKMTPHSHTDFEQGSLALNGAYIHYMRYPWTANMNEWRDDERIVASAPSLCIIPPTVIHTSQAVGEAGMRLVDIFAPVREDFSAKPGLVCNADEYPMPAHVQAKLQAAIAAAQAA